MNCKKHSENSWYFGNISQERSVLLLETYGEEGDFIVRDSETWVGMFVCEIKCASKVRRFRIIEEEGQLHLDGNQTKFPSLDSLIDFYVKRPPRGRDEKQVILKKPFAWPSEENSEEEVEDKLPSSKRLSQRVERLKLWIIEKEQNKPDIKERYLEEQLRKIEKIIPQTQFVHKVWHNEKDAIKKSYRQRIRSKQNIGDVGCEGKEKIKRESSEKVDMENHIMQDYIEINGGYVEQKIEVQEHMYLFVRLKTLYEELQKNFEDTLIDFEKDLSLFGRKLKDAKTGYVNVNKQLASSIDNNDRIDYQKKNLKELSKLEQKIRATMRNAKNAIQESLDKTDRGWEGQNKLRYTTSDLEVMRQIMNVIRNEIERNLKQVEIVMQDITEMKSSIESTLEALDVCREKLLTARKDSIWTLETLCRNLVPEHLQNKTPTADRRKTRARYSATIRKNSTRYACVRVEGIGSKLQGPNSAVTLQIPPDIDAVVMGHAHTDAKPFLHIIPGNECLISPIAEYHCETKNKTKGWFRIQIPHCVRKKEHLGYVTVRHGDIHENVPFTEVLKDRASDSDCYFNINEKYIIIHTTHFCQFVCTLCKRQCDGHGKAFIFGGMTPLGFTPLRSTIRLYMCSPLFMIRDYRQKVIEIEQTIMPSRHLVAEEDIQWNSEKHKTTQCAKIVVHAPRWTPRKPIKCRQTWIERERQLIHELRLSEMSDMFRCHNCVREPSILATFDFEYPGNHHETPHKELSFSGYLQMFLPSNQVILEVHVDVFPVQDSAKKQTNGDHRLLRKITKKVVCTIPELNDFGLSLGFTYDEITRKMTNYPRSVEDAAWSMACEWWDESYDSREEKKETLMNAVASTGKKEIVDICRGIFAEDGRSRENGAACSTVKSNQILLASKSESEENNGNCAALQRNATELKVRTKPSERSTSKGKSFKNIFRGSKNR